MRFIPYESFRLKSPLRAEDAIRRIAEEVEAARLFARFRRGHKSYQGTIDGWHFSMKRIGYRGSFVPAITGEIEPSVGGCYVNIEMKLQRIVSRFMVFWFACVGTFAVLALGIAVFEYLQGKIAGLAPWMIALWPVAMMAFAYLLALVGFKWEASWSKTHLRKVFQAERLIEEGEEENAWAA
jgi:hypothetical protein